VPHTLVVYRPGRRADDALRRLVEAAQRRGGRLTVLTPLAQEPEDRRCCDTRSVMWNEICRDLARENLARARNAVAGDDAVELGVLPFAGRSLADAVIREAVAREADEVALAAALGPLERLRLRRRSPVPVRA
jgi:hypothetical protein